MPKLGDYFILPYYFLETIDNAAYTELKKHFPNFNFENQFIKATFGKHKILYEIASMKDFPFDFQAQNVLIPELDKQYRPLSEQISHEMEYSQEELESKINLYLENINNHSSVLYIHDNIVI